MKKDGSFYAYSRYRKEIAEDCLHRCVYCDARDSEVGGAEAMQLDHFRPESFSEFDHLVNDPRNLHYACGRCNNWKSDLWPARGTDFTHDGYAGFIDPFSDDRRNYFAIAADGSIKALKPPATYMIRLLRLDREFLRKLRELRILRYRCRQRLVEIRCNAQSGKLPSQAELIQVCEAIERLL
ncbi:MAG TPA: HNH endonuclease [Kiritimatiellia bacterium]|nr:HNH endonuclease [Kiritimatiellia bacterium]